MRRVNFFAKKLPSFIFALTICLLSGSAMGQQFFLFPKPSVQIQFSSILASSVGQRSKLTYSISSKHEKAQVHVRIILDNGLQPETSELEWRGQVEVDKPVSKELSVITLRNGTWRIAALGTAVVYGHTIN